MLRPNSHFYFYVRRYQASDRAGFTLIETVMTLAVFTIGIVGIFSFAVANMNSVKRDSDRYLAANLAREGIEIVKNVRDSNWLKIDANVDCDAASAGIQICGWDDGLRDNYYILDYNTKYPPTPMTDVASEDGYWLDTKRLYIDSNGFYSHDVTGSATNIYRTIEIKNICSDISTNPPVEDIVAITCPPGTTKIGLQVIAHMRWSRGGQKGRLDMPDSLYNWRR